MIKITFTNKVIQNCHQVIPYYEGSFDKKLLKTQTGFGIIDDLKNEAGEIYTLLHQLSGKKIVLVCIGNSKSKDNISSFIRKAVSLLTKNNGKIFIDGSKLTDIHFDQLVFGSNLAGYKINKFKTEENGKKIDIHIYHNEKTKKTVFDKAISIAETYINMMDLVNLPSNIKTPYFIADYAVKSGKENGFKVKTIRGEDVKKQKLHALYEVGKGSINPPAFIVMEYEPVKSNSKPKKIGLVGKGISFDSGGISIKPSANMHYMKCDMAGAAAVIGIMEVASKLKFPHYIVGIVPSAENAVGGTSYRPGDIISSYSGKSIEVIDTDAEGRLILADGLSYLIKNYKPDAMIDLATLTGSCVAALGPFAAGLFSNNDDMAVSLYNSGIASGEKLWRLPMWDEYKPYMNSDMADIKNLSSVPVAGAITAAKFLELFTEDHKNWAHIDIAGVGFTDNDIFKTRTASGFGIRLLVDWILNQ